MIGRNQIYLQANFEKTVRATSELHLKKTQSCTANLKRSKVKRVHATRMTKVSVQQVLTPLKRRDPVRGRSVEFIVG